MLQHTLIARISAFYDAFKFIIHLFRQDLGQSKVWVKAMANYVFDFRPLEILSSLRYHEF
jgi:hypothetical protein